MRKLRDVLGEGFGKRGAGSAARDTVRRQSSNHGHAYHDDMAERARGLGYHDLARYHERRAAESRERLAKRRGAKDRVDEGKSHMVRTGYDTHARVELTPREHYSSGHKAFDVHHEGRHVGHVHSYWDTTRPKSRGSVRRVSDGVKRKRWMAHPPPRSEGDEFRRSGSGFHTRDDAVASLVPRK